MAFVVQTLSCLVVSGIAVQVEGGKPAPPGEWTVMIYGGVDSSAEAHILPHLSQLRSASKAGQRGHVVLLYDRAPGYTDDDKLFGENFEDTRLFELRDGQWHRVGGGSAFPEITLESKYEANTGDAHTLQKFIRFAKEGYPAKRQALIIFGHGHCQSVCPDESNQADDGTADELYPAELTDGDIASWRPVTRYSPLPTRWVRRRFRSSELRSAYWPIQGREQSFPFPGPSATMFHTH